MRLLIIYFETLITVPITPTDPAVTRIDRDLFDFSATLQWNSPLPGGAQSVIDNYTVVITPGEQTIVLDSPTLLATLQYNIENVFSITATNCVGRSSPLLSTIHYSKYKKSPRLT